MSLTLPPIDLQNLKPGTRDWLLAAAAREETTPQEILRRTLDRRATLDGFRDRESPPATDDIPLAAAAAN